MTEHGLDLRAARRAHRVMRLNLPRRLLHRSRLGARHLLSFLRMDRRYGQGFKPHLLLRGFLSQRAELYPFHRYDPRWFVNDWAVENRFKWINPGEVQGQLGNKLFLHLLLRELGFGHLPAPLIGVVTHGRFTSFSSHSSLASAFKAHEALIVKPIDGFGGRRVMRAQTVDAVPTVGMFLIEGLLQQHDYAAAIFPGAVNSIRVLTLRLNDEPPFIAAAAHRFGGVHSAPVDNFSRGGISALVDLPTGTLSGGRSNPGFHPSSHHVTHPDTGFTFAGTIVPRWAEVKAIALELMLRVPGVQIVGWDLCVTPGGVRLIEGNGSVPGTDLIQAHQPLLLDARTRRFFRAKGVISQRHFDELEQMAATGLPAAPAPAAVGVQPVA
jgi:glutathione synthase/RimK-type ligase-like ATP-grasp enzyme